MKQQLAFILQNVKKAIFDDLVKHGKKSGLNSFEQVCIFVIMHTGK